jgi:rod shape determining protein RodA
MLASWFTSRRTAPMTLRGLLAPLMISVVPALLVLKQPDLGSAMVFGGTMFAVFFWAGVPVSNLVLLASPVVSLLLAWSTALWSAWMIVLFVLLLMWRPFILESISVYLVNAIMGVLAILVWNHLDKYQRARITSFIDPAIDPAHTAYQAIQAKVAIGSGSWFGNGFAQGPLKRTGFIPEWDTDFIFAVVGEELGFVGVVVALVLFAVLLVTLVRIARRSSDPFASLVVFGIAGLFLTHIFENIGMTISLMPITGIPLPFFSYGGSFLVSTFLALGMAFRAASEERAAGYV